MTSIHAVFRAGASRNIAERLIGAASGVSESVDPSTDHEAAANHPLASVELLQLPGGFAVEPVESGMRQTLGATLFASGAIAMRTAERIAIHRQAGPHHERASARLTARCAGRGDLRRGRFRDRLRRAWGTSNQLGVANCLREAAVPRRLAATERG